jgi:hypothetical protein
VEWIKCLQECVEKSASNERIAQMANLQEVVLVGNLCQFDSTQCLIFVFQTRRTDQLLQQHLFKQDIFAERFQTKFDQERITSEVLNNR